MSEHKRIRRRWGIGVFFLLAIGLLALVAAGIVAIYEWRYTDRVYEGVAVSGIALGGLTVAGAEEAVREGLTPYPGPAIVLRHGERVWSLSPGSLGVAVDPQRTAAQAFRVGRQGLTASTSASLATLWAGLRTDLVEQWAALRHGAVITPVIRFDEDQVAVTLKHIAAEIDLPPREGTLTIAGLEISGVAGQVGRRLNVEATRAALAAQVRGGTGGVVDLVVEDRRPVILSVAATVDRAAGLLRQTLILAAQGLDGVQRFNVDPVVISGWLTLAHRTGADGVVELDVRLDMEQVTAFVQQIAEQLDRPAYDALLDFDRKLSQVIVLQPGRSGQRLDVAASAAAIQAAVLEGGPQPGSGNETADALPILMKTIALPLTVLSPKVDSDRIAEMGIVEQISEGTTFFAGSTRERIQNIATAASRFRGAIIPPGEEFSFYRFLGDVTVANGFVDSLIIRGDRTEVGVGGGVCQVSTTAFRAAFSAGLPILERWPHGYVVSWYGEPGLDASIYTPTADFRFRNDTGHYLLIQPEVDAARGRITFRFYGTRPQRTVEVAKPVISNVREAPEPLYQEDTTLQTGVIKQVDWAKDGMDVIVKRIIRYPDGRAREDKIVSRYRPWQAVYLYGPGTELPPEASGAAP